jgi:hypothetical protein
MAVEAQKAGNIKLATYWQSVMAQGNATSTIRKSHFVTGSSCIAFAPARCSAPAEPAVNEPFD